MKTKILATSVVVLLLVSMLAGMVQVYAIKPGDPGFTGIHFNLNLHGVPEGRNVPSGGDGRHSIFVPLIGDYELSIKVDGIQWRVTDCDGTDDGEVKIILPEDIYDAGLDGILGTGDDILIGHVKYYNVYVVGLGKPIDGAEAIIFPNAEFAKNEIEKIWRIGDVGLKIPGHGNGKLKGSGGGKPNWQNATDLFFLDLILWIEDLNGDGNWWDPVLGDYDVGEVVIYEDEWVFDIEYLLNYWWDVSNNDIGLMQIRFYPVFGNGNGNGNGKA